MNFESIASPNYLQYFSSKSCNEQDELFSRFLSDMETVSEGMCPANVLSPIQALQNIKEKTGVNADFCKAIKEWIKPQYISCLSDLEVFALLWFCSKQNNLTFSAKQYLMYANDGTISALLNRLKSK